MKRIFTLLVFIQLLYPSLYAQKTITAQINFDHNSYTLSETAQQQLDKLILVSNDAITFQYRLIGHTDSDGDVPYNQELSKNRCESVQHYLMTKGVTNESIDLNYLGEHSPLADNLTDEGKSANRRVEIVLRYEIIKTATALYEYFEKKSVQQFTINPAKDNNITAENGSIIRIPVDAYTYEDGSPLNGQAIDIKIDEAITPAAMLLYRLNTSNDNTALSTGGMIRVEVSANGRKLKMKAGKAVDVFVPSIETNTSMNLYRGNRNAQQTMDWEQLDQAIEILDEAEVNIIPKTELKKTNVSQNVFKAIAEIDIEIPEKPGTLEDLNLPPLPNHSVPQTILLKEPREPKFPPRRLKAHSSNNILLRLFDNKRARQKELDEKYEKQMTIFKEKVAKYKTDLAAYLESKEKFDKELEQLEIQHKEEEKLILEKRLEIIQPYYEECIAYEAAIRLRNRFKTLAIKGTPELLEAYLFPQRRQPLKDTAPLVFDYISTYQMSRADCPNYKLVICEDYNNPYLSAIDKKTIELFRNLEEYENIVRLKDEMIDKVNKNRLIEKSKNNQAIASVTNSIQYYNFKITSAEVFWCNIDTPLPEGRLLAIFQTPSKVIKGFEIFAFRPAKKSVHYITKDMRKQIIFDEDDKVNYIAFNFDSGEPVLANGQFEMNEMQNVELDFRPTTVAEIEQAILNINQ